MLKLIAAYSRQNGGNTLSAANTVNTLQNKSITYNILNLPQVYTISNGTVTYTYDANGWKLRKTFTPTSGSVVTEDYINGLQYTTTGTTTGIDFIQTEEGRALYTAGSYDLEYSLSDHLGNTRISFDLYNGALRTDQQDDYYAFGMEISGGTTVDPKNLYLYNKKELQEELGQYDYGARFYDPVIARWTTVDPKAEKSRKYSPFVYANDNPIRNIDPDGMITIDGADKNVNGGQATYTTTKDGTVTWTNATEDTKKIGNDMLKTDVGKKQLDGMISSTKQVKLVDDKTSIVKDKNGVNRLGYTKQAGNHVTVTIYEKAIAIATIAPEGFHMTETFGDEKLNASNYTQDEHIGAVGTHEATHVLDPKSNAIGNPKATEEEMEIKPNENELEYYHEIDKQ